MMGLGGNESLFAAAAGHGRAVARAHVHAIRCRGSCRLLRRHHHRHLDGNQKEVEERSAFKSYVGHVRVRWCVQWHVCVKRTFCLAWYILRALGEMVTEWVPLPFLPTLCMIELRL